jgi:predicted DCC family thiol-disulfide oxidoreductase YuxK
MQHLYVLYDQRCGLCSQARRWCLRQRAFLTMTFLPAGSERASQMFPGLTERGEPSELIVVSDDGGVYRNGHAWIMCLYALEEHRELSLRLARPLLLPTARLAFALVSKHRRRLSTWLNLASDDDVAAALSWAKPPDCQLACSQPSSILPAISSGS